MKQFLHIISALCLLIIAIILVEHSNKPDLETFTSQELTKILKDNGTLPRGKQLDSFNKRPSDWYYRQRAYPYDDIPREKQKLA
ncbi:MAG: hypothetical protein GY865_15580, partial [candidate division Zixibacteria bacterium]|nr:hypothetical protein [candidate division Zixibacteria bacterium]